MANSLIVIGGGGFAREVIWLAESLPEKWRVMGVLDDAEGMQGNLVGPVPVLGKISNWPKYKEAQFAVAVGAPRTRRAIVNTMRAYGEPEFATLIHPSALYSAYILFGKGTIVTAGCILTTDITIGEHCILNLGVTVGHDVKVGNYCTLAPQASISGQVKIADGVEIGTGATIVQQLKIGTGSLLGAGSVVTKDVEDNVFVIGAPARHVRQLEVFL